MTSTSKGAFATSVRILLFLHRKFPRCNSTFKGILWESWKAPSKGYSVTGFPHNKSYKDLEKTLQPALFTIDGFLLYFLQNSLSLSLDIQIPIVAHVILYTE